MSCTFTRAEFETFVVGWNESLKDALWMWMVKTHQDIEKEKARILAQFTVP
jgi:hypothetical protein